MAASAVICRRADRSDVAGIKSMLAELEDETGWDYISYTIDSCLESEWGGVYIAVLGSDVVGVTCTRFPSPREAWLHGINVVPRARGRGVGTALARYQIDQAFAMGASVVRLGVLADNETGKRLAARFGFSRGRLWTLASYPLTGILCGGVRPQLACGHLRHDALRFVENRRYALACASPDPWVLCCYRSAVTRMAQHDAKGWLLTWPVPDGTDPAMVCHVSTCNCGDTRAALVDLLVTTASRAQAEQFAAGLLSVVSELAVEVDASHIMFSVPARLFAPVRPPARWFGLVTGEAREWAMEVFELRR